MNTFGIRARSRRIWNRGKRYVYYAREHPKDVFGDDYFVRDRSSREVWWNRSKYFFGIGGTAMYCGYQRINDMKAFRPPNWPALALGQACFISFFLDKRSRSKRVASKGPMKRKYVYRETDGSFKMEILDGPAETCKLRWSTRKFMLVFCAISLSGWLIGKALALYVLQNKGYTRLKIEKNLQDIYQLQAEDDLRLLEKFQNQGRARTSREEAYMNDFHINEKRLGENNFQDALIDVELKPNLDELYHTSVDRAHARVPSE